MPRLGHAGTLNEQQIKDVVGLLSTRPRWSTSSCSAASLSPQACCRGRRDVVPGAECRAAAGELYDRPALRQRLLLYFTDYAQLLPTYLREPVNLVGDASRSVRCTRRRGAAQALLASLPAPRRRTRSPGSMLSAPPVATAAVGGFASRHAGQGLRAPLRPHRVAAQWRRHLAGLGHVV